MPSGMGWPRKLDVREDKTRQHMILTAGVLRQPTSPRGSCLSRPLTMSQDLIQPKLEGEVVATDIVTCPFLDMLLKLYTAHL